MTIHHLNCGSLHLPGAPLVCHVLLIESDCSLTLVDTGLGLEDIKHPAARIGPYRHVLRAKLAEEETALRQVQALGFHPEDVRDIILTHGDSDHAGGISDFPWARIHVGEIEARSITQPNSWFARQRYNKHQWGHSPTIVAHPPGAEQWHGFTGVRHLEEIPGQVLLVPMYGHSAGHTAVAVGSGDRWILHAGDSFYHPAAITHAQSAPPFLKWQEWAFAHDRAQLRDNQHKLRQLHGGVNNIDIINSHDPSLFHTALSRQ